MFKQYDIVITKEDFERIPEGTIGTVLEVYENNDYEVEFVNAEGKTVKLLTINEKHLIRPKGH